MPDPTPTFDPDGTALAPAEGPGELGRLGGYVVRRLLGEGGMGRVYAADDPALGRQVALKVMRPEAADRPEAKERFLREARAAAAVAHDHIVRIYQVGEGNGVPFIAMEMLNGHPLDTLVGKPVPMTEVIRIGAEVASALAVAHAAGLVHRDIKPANLWLENPSGRVKVLDFGLARLAREATLTNTGQIFGTPAYMAPEQAAAATLDGRADVFSLGCVLYHLATGRRPFDGADVFAVLHQIANLTPPPPHHLNPSVPPALSDLITRMMAKTAADRPTSAEVADALRTGAAPASFAQQPPAFLPPGSPDRKQRLIELLLEAKNTHAHLSPTAFSIPFFLIAVGCGLGGMALGMTAGFGVFKLLTLIPGASERWLESMTYVCGMSGLALGGLGGLFGYLAWYRRRWRRRLVRGTDAVAREFQVEAARWGGPLALRDRALIDSVLAKVVEDDFLVSPPAPAEAVVSTTDPGSRKQALLAILHEAKLAHAHTLPTALALLEIPVFIGLVLGGPGCSLAVCAGTMWALELAGVEHDWLAKRSPVTGVVALAVGGLAALVVQLVRFDRRKRRRITTATQRLTTEYPVEAAAWGREMALRDAKAVESLLSQVSQASFQVSPPPT